ncbi:MAG: hypothetical protein DMG61_21190 [Acidobacteria bacterium]|nr:MAG: hypothetical protein DMG61_21190 [Acidobacteriota bacterium]PYY19229.1 MAG: hypothetical protein DMG60_05095 [Acidobacteriota bacterium]
MAHFVFESRVVCGLDLISDGKGNSAVRLEAGLDFGTTFTRGFTTGLFSTVPQKARHCSLTMLSSVGIKLDRPAGCAGLSKLVLAEIVLKGHGFSASGAMPSAQT